MAGNGFDTLGARFGLKGIEISSREKGKALKPVCCQIPKAVGAAGIALMLLNHSLRTAICIIPNQTAHQRSGKFKSDIPLN